jgi:hypothetical protein
MARLLSVNVGRPREIVWRGKTVYTSVWKEPVEGRRLVRRLNVDGDAQGDLHGHGAEQLFAPPKVKLYPQAEVPLYWTPTWPSRMPEAGPRPRPMPAPKPRPRLGHSKLTSSSRGRAVRDLDGRLLDTHPLVFATAFRARIRCRASMTRSAASSMLNRERLRIRS